MSESVQFWLDNKMSAGVKVAGIGDQQLVVYREKFYVVEKGAARMKGGKPLHYSKSSMPLIWKKALRGESPPPADLYPPPDDALPEPSFTKRVRARKEKQPPPAQETSSAPEPVRPEATPEAKQPKVNKQTTIKPANQTSVAASCPYCNNKHELPLEKGKNGKPFFVLCTKCQAEFAVRFVPVTVYQAQVAGFR
ncbi:MAG TPA: hypothetical protein VGJ93_08305 [Desulfuromonadaceae bacterium]|jgi:hypothetical protein